MRLYLVVIVPPLSASGSVLASLTYLILFIGNIKYVYVCIFIDVYKYGYLDLFI